MWLTIFQNGDYPLHDKNTSNFRPDVDLWDNDIDYKYYCYILHGDFIYYGYYKNINCFMCLSYQDIEKTYAAFKNQGLKHLYTDEDLQAMEAYNWLYLDGRMPDKFYYDSENINEGVLTILTYFDNNSIESKEIIDLETGECLYYMKWTRSQYYCEDRQRQVQYLVKYSKLNNNNIIKYKKDYPVKSKMDNKIVHEPNIKWIVTNPLSFAGWTLDQIMNYGNTEKTNRRNPRA